MLLNDRGEKREMEICAAQFPLRFYAEYYGKRVRQTKLEPGPSPQQ